MRIAVVEFTGRGGLIHYAFQFCRAMSAAGVEVTLITDRHYELEALPAPFRVEKLLRLWDPKPVAPSVRSRFDSGRRRLRRSVRGVRYYREWTRLFRFLREDPPDIVQLGDIRFALDLVPLARLKGSGLRLADICHNVKPFAPRERAGPSFRSGPLHRVLYRRIYGQFETVFVHFECNRRDLITTYRLPSERVVTLPFGDQSLFDELRDPSLSSEGLRQRLDLPPRAPVVLFFGSLARYKGIDLLLSAFQRIRHRHPTAHLVIGGFPLPGFNVEEARKAARKLRIDPWVRWIPEYVPSQEVAAWMGMAAVVVFPYREIFQSGALQVAQTLGASIVASRVGAMPEMILDGQTGLLVPPQDPPALAEAIQRYLNDPEFAARVGARAARDARERCGWDRVATVVLERYQRCLGNGKPPLGEAAS